MQRCTIGIVNYNTRDWLLRALEAAQKQCADEVLVMDNASTDGSAEAARSRFPNARVTVGPNEGFGAACNRLLEQCCTEYLLLLNSDAILHPGAMEKLIGELGTHSKAAVAAPRLLSEDGHVQRSWRQFPGTAAWLLDNGLSRRLVGFRAGGPSRPVPWVFGAAIATRTSAMRQVGGFDPDFFLYCEDIDLCYRLWRAGWEVLYVPAAAALHIGGASTGQERSGMPARLVQSTERFYGKHYGGLRRKMLTALLRSGARA